MKITEKARKFPCSFFMLKNENTLSFDYNMPKQEVYQIIKDTKKNLEFRINFTMEAGTIKLIIMSKVRKNIFEDIAYPILNIK